MTAPLSLHKTPHPSRRHSRKNRNFPRGFFFGFNGQEKESQITGSETHTSAEFWVHDTRLGRRWQLDPVSMYFLSDYSCLGLNPILITDPNGDKIKIEGNRQNRREVRQQIRQRRSMVDDFDKEFKKARFSKQNNLTFRSNSARVWVKDAETDSGENVSGSLTLEPSAVSLMTAQTFTSTTDDEDDPRTHKIYAWNSGWAKLPDSTPLAPCASFPNEELIWRDQMNPNLYKPGALSDMPQDALDLGTFMSGHPKAQVEIKIHRREDETRCFSSQTVGYFKRKGAMDRATIRSMKGYLRPVLTRQQMKRITFSQMRNSSRTEATYHER